MCCEHAEDGIDSFRWTTIKEKARKKPTRFHTDLQGSDLMVSVKRNSLIKSMLDLTTFYIGSKIIVNIS